MSLVVATVDVFVGLRQTSKPCPSGGVGHTWTFWAGRSQHGKEKYGRPTGPHMGCLLGPTWAPLVCRPPPSTGLTQGGRAADKARVTWGHQVNSNMGEVGRKSCQNIAHLPPGGSMYVCTPVCPCRRPVAPVYCSLIGRKPTRSTLQRGALSLRFLAVLAATLADDGHVVDEHGAILAVHAHLTGLYLLGHTAVTSTLTLTTPVLHFMPWPAARLGVHVDLPVLDGMAGGSWKGRQFKVRQGKFVWMEISIQIVTTLHFFCWWQNILLLVCWSSHTYLFVNFENKMKVLINTRLQVYIELKISHRIWYEISRYHINRG